MRPPAAGRRPGPAGSRATTGRRARGRGSATLHGGAPVLACPAGAGHPGAGPRSGTRRRLCIQPPEPRRGALPRAGPWRLPNPGSPGRATGPPAPSHCRRRTPHGRSVRSSSGSAEPLFRDCAGPASARRCRPACGPPPDLCAPVPGPNRPRHRCSARSWCRSRPSDHPRVARWCAARRDRSRPRAPNTTAPSRYQTPRYPEGSARTGREFRAAGWWGRWSRPLDCHNAGRRRPRAPRGRSPAPPHSTRCRRFLAACWAHPSHGHAGCAATALPVP